MEIDKPSRNSFLPELKGVDLERSAKLRQLTSGVQAIRLKSKILTDHVDTFERPGVNDSIEGTETNRGKWTSNDWQAGEVGFLSQDFRATYEPNSPMNVNVGGEVVAADKVHITLSKRIDESYGIDVRFVSVSITTGQENHGYVLSVDNSKGGNTSTNVDENRYSSGMNLDEAQTLVDSLQDTFLSSPDKN